MRIKDLCKIRMGHTFRKGIKPLLGGDVAVIQPRNITDDGGFAFSDDEPAQVSVDSPNTIALRDVLVVNRGRFAAAVFNLEDPGPWIAPSSVLVLTVKSDIVLPEYVALYVNSLNGQKMFYRHQETTTVPFVSAGNLGRMEMLIPSIDRQWALVGLDMANRAYSRLTDRKLELRKQIMNQALKDTKSTA